MSAAGVLNEEHQARGNIEVELMILASKIDLGLERAPRPKKELPASQPSTLKSPLNLHSLFPLCFVLGWNAEHRLDRAPPETASSK